MHSAGYNVLPRNGVDWPALEAHYQRHQPAASVVFLEPSAIDRLRVQSPRTLFIYRDAVPGFDNDDDAQVRWPAANKFVDYLHAKAPPGAAFYLGNEPGGDLDWLAKWTLMALDHCDHLGRVGVALNLAYGHPEPEDWQGPLKPVLQRLSRSKHYLGLHEYWTPGNLGDGYWTNRWIGQVPDTVNVLLTEIGALALNADDTLNAVRGWRLLPNYPAHVYALEIKQVLDKARQQPNFKGACLFSAGNWNGCEVGKDIYDEMEQYEGQVMTQTQPEPINCGQKMLDGTLALINASTVNFRAERGTTSTILGKFTGGETVNYWSIPVAENNDSWYKIEYQGKIGWASAKYARPSGGVPDTEEGNFPDLPPPFEVSLDNLSNEQRNVIEIFARQTGERWIAYADLVKVK